MPTAGVMTAGFNIVVLALTPTERWKAAGRFGTGMTEHWFILTGVAVIIVLTALLLMISLRRTAQERKVSGQLFVDYAEKRGLSGRERQILLEIANKAGLKRSQAIFSMVGSFDHGAGKMIEESLAQQGAEESQWLRTELSFLREKLGFRKKPVSIGSPTKLKRPSSRQIPTGKQLHITRRTPPDLGDIESTVIKNNNTELTLKLTAPVESKLGEFWRARYYFGVSVWEFDTSVVRCNGDILVLNHSDDMRFISRRRFLRVRVNKPAFIARFPFSRTLPTNSISSKKGHWSKRALVKNKPGNTWGPPEFMPAIVTELGGPGLRIEAPLEVKPGDRVLVIVNLSETIDARYSILDTRRESRIENQESRIVEDIGEVRHTKAIQDGFSIAVELTGLSDSNVSELIRATNAASIRTNGKRQDSPDSVEREEKVSEPAAVQGT